MKRQAIRDRAFVIRTYDFGEADRIVVLFTQTQGLIRGVAKGVRRAKSRFGSRLQPFVELDVQLYPGPNLAFIASADTVNYFGAGIIEDLLRFSAAHVVLEATERLSQASYGESEELFALVRQCLQTLQSAADPVFELDVFLIQAMELSGWSPTLFACSQCGAPGPHNLFHPSPGGALCPDCMVPGALHIDGEVLHMMWLIAQGHIPAALAEATPARLHSLHEITKLHLQWHLEKTLASLHVLDQSSF